ncbi:MAG: lyase [Gammaproteobacteria bacterium]|nr:lyase [Gammaproteobacteria bacterium]
MKSRAITFGAIVLSLASGCQADSEKEKELVAENGSVDITEWQVPYEKTRPRDPFVDTLGRVWFCGQAGAYIAYLVPETGKFKKFDLADGASPHNLIIAADDGVWYAANTLPYIGQMDPVTGAVHKYPMPEPVTDPHTLVFDSIGNIWFTAQRSNHVGRLDTQSGTVDVIEIPVASSRPYGIKVGPDDHPWIVLFGTNKLATVDPETMQLELVDLPRAETRPRRLEITANGLIWYGDYAKGVLGRFNPKTREVSEWPMPGGEGARPYGTALDDRGRIWLAEGGSPNRLSTFDTSAEQFVHVTDVPKALGSIRHMYFHPATREIWFGEDSNYVGRARIR